MIVFKVKFVELSSVLGVLSNEVGDFVVEDVSDSLSAGSSTADVLVRLLLVAITSEARVDITGRGRLSLMARARHLGVHYLSSIVCRESTIMDRVGIKLLVRLITRVLLLGADLSDRRGHRADVNVCYFDSLVVADFKRFIDNLRRSLNSETLLRASALAQTTTK